MIPNHFFPFSFFLRTFWIFRLFYLSASLVRSYSIHNLHLVGIIIFASLQGVMYVFMLAHFYKNSNGETVGRREQQAIYIQVTSRTTYRASPFFSH